MLLCAVSCYVGLCDVMEEQSLTAIRMSWCPPREGLLLRRKSSSVQGAVESSQSVCRV